MKADPGRRDPSGREHFRKWAPRYERSLLQAILFEPTHRAALDAASSVLPAAGTILDVGCGTGKLLERAAGRWPGALLTGIDLVPEMIREARRKHPDDPRFRFEVADSQALPLEAASFDLAFSTHSFHHWPDQAGGIREVARVLRRGGLFVLADAACPFVPSALASRFHGERARERLFGEAGLSVVLQRRPLRLGRQVLITVGRSGPAAARGAGPG